MESLAALPGVVHANPFHLYDDDKRQPVKCDLVVQPAQGWAVATELADGGPGLVLCPLTLATCNNIEPEKLALFVRYAYDTSYESIYSLHFAASGRDLFDGVRFTEATRHLVPIVDVPALLNVLSTGQTATWRALRPVCAARV
jgi:hypothetical protein